MAPKLVAGNRDRFNLSAANYKPRKTLNTRKGARHLCRFNMTRAEIQKIKAFV